MPKSPLAAQIAAKISRAIAARKRLFYEQLELSIEAAYEGPPM